MATDPVVKIRREALQMRVSQAGVSKAAIQASLKKTTREPKGIEIGYQAFLVSVQKQINGLIRKSLPELYSLLDLARVDGGDIVVWAGGHIPTTFEISERTDGLSDDVVAAFNSLRTSIRNLSTKTDGVLRIGVQDYGNKTAAFSDAKYNDPLMNLLGIGDVSANIEQSILSGWVTENTQLVGNMNAQQLGKLETLFLRSLRDGSRSAQVVGEVAHILGANGENVNRARLIARDQIGKLDGQLSRQKQTEAGIKGYAWRGALDGRERQTHVDREGVIFLWSEPPPDGHPGQPVGCRCGAEPDLSFLGKEFAPEPRSESDFSQTTTAEQAKSRNIQARQRRRRAARNRAPAVAS
jgi:SPP1 gp7 family putative phage head morphogenesis protein